jgi:O-acetyl-ADP-ribose deacetylase (regulator of RNase III)
MKLAGVYSNRKGGAVPMRQLRRCSHQIPDQDVNRVLAAENGEGDEDEKLRNATLNSLKRATEKGMKSIAFPAISTGIFGFPKDRCAQIMLTTISEFLESQETSLERVILCLWSRDDLVLFGKALAEAN